MKDNIKREFINNRKLITEIRFKPNPRILDERGNLINKLVESNVIENPHWELGGANITVVDNTEQIQSKKRIFIDIQRISYVSSAGDSNESYYSAFSKVYKVFKETIATFDIKRIGCRIIGTYSCDSKDYATIIEKFKKHFPNQFLLEEFPAQDLRFQLVYQNGMYNIGPIRGEEDQFLKQEFPFDDRNNNIGFAIDTDNYILKESSSQIINESSIKDVYLTSLSVEKLLFEKLKTL